MKKAIILLLAICVGMDIAEYAHYYQGTLTENPFSVWYNSHIINAGTLVCLFFLVKTKWLE